MGLCLPRSSKIAGPAILFRFLRHPGADGIQDDIPADLKEVAVLLDKDSLVPSLEQMARSAVTFVEELGIDAVHLPHADRKIAVRGLDEKMVMVGHEAVGVADPVVALIDVLEGVQEVQAVGVVLEDGLLSLPREVT